MPISQEIMQRFKKEDLTVFLETGTGGGVACNLALNCGFKEIYSCDLSKDLSAQAMSHISKHANFAKTIIRLQVMDSRDFLRAYLENEMNAFVWLDAHYSYGNTMGSLADDPLMQELEIIAKARNEGRFTGVVLVDDCRGREKFVADKIIEQFKGVQFAWQADPWSPTDIAVIPLYRSSL